MDRRGFIAVVGGFFGAMLTRRRRRPDSDVLVLADPKGCADLPVDEWQWVPLPSHKAINVYAPVSVSMCYRQVTDSEIEVEWFSVSQPK